MITLKAPRTALHPLRPSSSVLRRATLGLVVAGVATTWTRGGTNTQIWSTLHLVAHRRWTHTAPLFNFAPTSIANSNMQRPQSPPKWTHTPDEVLQITKDTIELTKKAYSTVASLPEDKCDFNSVFAALDAAGAELLVIADPLTFYQYVAPDKALRDASSQAEILINEFNVEQEMRIDIFKAKQAAETNIKATGAKLSPEEERLVEKSLLDGTRAGLALPEKDRDQLAAWKKELSTICVEFSKNYNEENGVVSFTKEELTGVPEDVVSGYTKNAKDSNLLDVTFKTPDIFPLFKYAQNSETRRKAFEAYENRLSVNTPLMEKGLAIRRKMASLLGYKTWADYVTEVKMVKNADATGKFVSELENKLRPVGVKDRETLLALKKNEHEQKNLPFDGEFYIWDYRYYDRKYIEESLDLDDMLVKEYFPVTKVVPTILEIYQSLLGVHFESIETDTWHQEVQKFAVWENGAKDESGFIGYCYLDLYPREAKYSHAAVWGLLPGYDLPDGKRHYPVTAMVANLAKSRPSKPAIMTHDDVVTFFHEMGHVFHGLLSKTKYARFHGTSVARDFVEAPSQMLENWCWEPKVLSKMSSHHERGEPLSAELIDKVVKSRYINVGLYYLRQLFFASFDLKVHTDQEAEDYTKLWNNLRESVSLVKNGKEFYPGQASFAHIMGGYDAGYYGYTYSLVFAADMYRSVFKKDPLSPELGKRYRERILLPGGSRDESESLKDFLGREPNANAFLDEVFGTSNANL